MNPQRSRHCLMFTLAVALILASLHQTWRIDFAAGHDGWLGAYLFRRAFFPFDIAGSFAGLVDGIAPPGDATGGWRHLDERLLGIFERHINPLSFPSAPLTQRTHQ